MTRSTIASMDSLANPNRSPSDHYRTVNTGVDVPLMYKKNGKAVVTLVLARPPNSNVTRSTPIGQVLIPKTVFDNIHPSRTSQAMPAFPPQPWVAELPSTGDKVFGSSLSNLNPANSTFSRSTQAQSFFRNFDIALDNTKPQNETGEQPTDLTAAQQQLLHNFNPQPQPEKCAETTILEEKNMHRATHKMLDTTHDTLPTVYRADVKACIDLAHICKHNNLPPPLIEVEITPMFNGDCEFSAKVMLGRMGDHVFSSTRCMSREDARRRALSLAVRAFEKMDEMTKLGARTSGEKVVAIPSAEQTVRRPCLVAEVHGPRRPPKRPESMVYKHEE